MAEPVVRRRRRPATACTLCRRRRIKCDRQRPCGHCVKSQNLECVYDSEVAQHLPPRVASSSKTKNTPVQLNNVPLGPNGKRGATRENAKVALNVGEARESQISHSTPISMYSQLQQQQQATPTSIESYTSSIGGTWYVHDEDTPRPIIRGMTHKTRHLGQSHWMNLSALFKDIFIDIEPFLREPTCPVVENLQKCKSLARTIKAQRRPSWPPPTSQLPSKALSDELLECYLRTTETVYRVVHVPSFRSDYESLWSSDPKPDPAFLLLVKLVLSIGAAAYDDDFSLRKSALHWVYEAQLWLAGPCAKHRLNLLGLQIQVLALLARDIVGVDGDLVYTSAGDLLRRAISMGLHVEPPHLSKLAPMVVEMRRRMWNTVLEICIQSSLASGSPPLLTLGDFTAEPPRDANDDQLGGEGDAPGGEGTDMSLPLVLRSTLPTRLAIVQLLNGNSKERTYDDVLRLDNELRTACKAIAPALRSSKHARGSFGVQMVDLLMQAYLSALHVPFANPSLSPSAFAFSRRRAVETAMKMWYILHPPNASDVSAAATPSTSSSSTTGTRVHTRFSACGPGIFRVAGMHAALVVASELRAQIAEDERLEGPVMMPVRPDLLAVVGEAQRWCLERIRVGDTNVKGYQMFRMIGAQIEGMMKGMGRGEVARKLVEAAVEAEEEAIPMLEGMVEREGEVGGYDAGEPDWDISLADDLFDEANVESMGWVFNDGNTQLSFW